MRTPTSSNLVSRMIAMSAQPDEAIGDSDDRPATRVKRIVWASQAAKLRVSLSSRMMHEIECAVAADLDGMELPEVFFTSVEVAGHVVTPLLAQVSRCWSAGDTAGALAAFRAAAPAIDALNGAGQQAPTAKAALELLGLIPSRATRLPIAPLPDEDLPALRAGLAAAGVIDLVAG